MDSRPPALVPGPLQLRRPFPVRRSEIDGTGADEAGKKHARKRRRKEETTGKTTAAVAHDDGLTAAQRKAEAHRMAMAAMTNRDGKSYDDRVADYNQRLATQTQYNEMPRISGKG